MDSFKKWFEDNEERRIEKQRAVTEKPLRDRGGDNLLSRNAQQKKMKKR